MNRLIEFEYNDRSLAAYCPASAVYDIFEKFGVTDDIAAETHFLESTREGWDNCCWLLAEFCRWGELWRRQQGEDRREMITVGELQLAPPQDMPRFRELVADTLAAGFRRDIPDEDGGEVDLVLREIERKKKDPPRGRFAHAISPRRPKA